MQKNGGFRASVGISPAKKRVVYPLLYFIFCYFILLSIPGKGTSTPKRVTTRHSSGGCHIIGQKHPSVNIPFTDFFLRLYFRFSLSLSAAAVTTTTAPTPSTTTNAAATTTAFLTLDVILEWDVELALKKCFCRKKSVLVLSFLFFGRNQSSFSRFFFQVLCLRKNKLFFLCRSHCGSYLNLATVIILVTIFRHRLSVYRSSKFRGI